MNSEHAEASSNHNPKDTAADRSSEDGRPGREGHVQPGDVFARRAGAFAKGLPARLDEQLRRNPYATLALACMAATTVGVVLSSRVMRAVLTATMTAAALDLVRAAVRGARANVEAV
jgi:hypothetical protein